MHAGINFGAAVLAIARVDGDRGRDEAGREVRPRNEVLVQVVALRPRRLVNELVLEQVRPFAVEFGEQFEQRRSIRDLPAGRAEIDDGGEASTDDVDRAKKKAEETVAEGGKMVDTIIGQKEKDIMEV